MVGSREVRVTDGKRKRLFVGPDAAQARQLRKASELNAISTGIALVPTADEPTGRPLGVAVTEFLDERKLAKEPKTYAVYSKALECFQESC